MFWRGERLLRRQRGGDPRGLEERIQTVMSFTCMPQYHAWQIQQLYNYISFRENGNEFYGSIFGSFITLLVILVISIYGIERFSVMLNYGDTKFNSYSVKLPFHMYFQNNVCSWRKFLISVLKSYQARRGMRVADI